MLRRHRLIPLLAAVLIVQSLVAALPHTHGSTVEGQAWQAVSSIDSAHHCLACSVHVPVVEPVSEFDQVAASTIAMPVSVDCESSDVSTPLSTASPRGPPRIV